MNAIVEDVIVKLMDETCDPAMGSYSEAEVVGWLYWLVANLRPDVEGCGVCRNSSDMEKHQ